MQISAILSDYDGTLCPTTSIGNQNENLIPADLETVLWNISEMIPICIISSKDFEFLHNKTRFASILSCVLGTETLVLSQHKNRKMLSLQTKSREYTTSDRISECQEFGCIKNNYLSVDEYTLQRNSQILSQLAEEIASDFKEISIEHKFTTNKKILAGITIDWRHKEDWKPFKTRLEPQLTKLIIESQRKVNNADSVERSNIYVQTYVTHPFVDIYATKCDKGIAYDCVISEIQKITDGVK